MTIKFLGQSCLSITVNSNTILVDPAISVNPLAKDKIDIDTLQADYILLTHAHGDHVADVEPIAKRTGAKIIANYEMANYYKEKGFDAHDMNHGGTAVFDFGTVKCVPASHSSVFPDMTYGGNPCGFVVSANGKAIYIAGDTALTMEMKLIPMFYKLDLAVLPLGDNYTMGIEEAVMASKFVEVDTILGCHYDSFPILEIDHNAAKKAFDDAGKTLVLLDIEEKMTL